MSKSSRRTAGHRWRTAAWVGLGVLLTAMAAQDALGQDIDTKGSFDLVGTVVDEAGRPLVGAFVSLEASDWGSLTSEAGRFVIPDVRPGAQALTVELIGYETLRWAGTARDGDALTLSLAPRPILLEGLNVVTDRFATRRKAAATSVRWFDRSELAVSPHDDVIDFVAVRTGLARLPCDGNWTSDCFRVRGRLVQPAVWIDEVPVIGGVDYLRTFRPHELHMVEVYARGRQIRAYTHQFMERAAKIRLQPISVVF